MSLNKFNIFSTPIWQKKILDDEKNNILRNNILNRSKKEPSVQKTNIGGWQSNDIKDEKIFKDLFSEIDNSIKSTELKIKTLIIRQAWCNVNRKNNWNIIHNHGQYNLSAIYFVQKPKDSGSLALRDPRAILTASWGGWADKIYDLTNENAVIYLNTTEKDLIIFPSFLDHFVSPSNTDEERISIAMDIDCIF